MNLNEDPITIEDAARKIKMHRDRLKQLCIAGGIAIRWGGTDKRPRLKVLLSEVRRLVLSQRYSPIRRQHSRRPLHPDVTC